MKIHYQGEIIPNTGFLNKPERIAASIHRDMLALSTGLIMRDVMCRFEVCRTTAGEAVRIAKVWAGMRKRLDG